MAENTHSTPASERAEENRANLVLALVAPFLIALSVWGMLSPDPVVTGHAYAVEAMR